MTGLEPARLVALVPKTSVSTIPPHRHMAAREGLEPSTYGLTVRRSTDWTNGPYTRRI